MSSDGDNARRVQYHRIVDFRVLLLDIKSEPKRKRGRREYYKLLQRTYILNFHEF